MAGEYLPPVVAELKADIADFLAKIEEAKLAMRSLKDEADLSSSFGGFDDSGLRGDLQEIKDNLSSDLYDMRIQAHQDMQALDRDVTDGFRRSIATGMSQGVTDGSASASKNASDAGDKSGNAFTKAFKNRWVLLTASGLIPAGAGMVGGLASGLLGGITGTLGVGLSAIAAKYALTLAETNKTFAANWTKTKADMAAYLSSVMAPAFGELGKTLGSLVKSVTPQIGGIFTNLLQGFNQFLKAGSPAIKSFLDSFQSLSGSIAVIDRQFGQDMGPLLQGIVNLVQPMFTSLEKFPNILKDSLSGVGSVLTGLGQGLNSLMVDAAPLITATFSALGQLLPVLGTAIGEMVSGLGPFITTLATDLSPILSSLGQVLGPVLNALGQDLTPILNALAPILSQVVKLLGSGLTAILVSLVPVFQQMMPEIQQVVQEFLQFASQALPMLLPLLPSLAKLLNQILKNAEPMIPVFGRFLNAILPLIPPLVTLIGKLLDLATWLERVVGGPLNKFVAFLEGKMVTGIAAGIKGVASFITYLTNHFVPAMKDTGSWFANSFPKPFIAIGNWFTGPFVNFFVRMGSSIKHEFEQQNAFINRIPGDIMKFFANIGSWLFNAGKQLIQGLINGIGSMIGKLEGVMKSVASTVTSIPSKLWHMLSPSRVFHQMGINVVQGLINGIDQTGPALSNSMVKLSHRVVGGFSQSGVGVTGGYAPSGGGYGATTIQFHINAGTVLYNEQQFAALVVQALQRWGMKTPNTNISYQSVRGRKAS